MGARAAGEAWEIVDMGQDTFEVVVSAVSAVEDPADADDKRRDGTSTVEEVPSEALAARLSRTDDRVLAIERRLGQLTRHEQRIDGLELAHAQTERRLEQRDRELRSEIAAIYRQAEQEVADSKDKPGWRQRRLEVKLARLERDRKLRRAEERLAERSEAFLAEVEREGVAATASLHATRDEIERGRDRLAELIERIDAAEARLRAAEARTTVTRVGSSGGSDL